MYKYPLYLDVIVTTSISNPRFSLTLNSRVVILAKLVPQQLIFNISSFYTLDCRSATMKRLFKKLSCAAKGSESQTPAEHPEVHVTLIDEISDTFYLSDLSLHLLNYSSPRIELHTLGDLGIRYESSDPDDTELCAEPHEQPFLSPMEPNKLQALKPDLSKMETKDSLEHALGDWYEPMKSRFYREVNQENAQTLCGTLSVAFNSLLWKNEKDKSSTHLNELTTWRERAVSANSSFGRMVRTNQFICVAVI